MRSFYLVKACCKALNHFPIVVFATIFFFNFSFGSVAGTAPAVTCNSSLGSFSIFNINSSSSTALSNGAVLSLSTLPSSWNIEVAASGNTDGSVKFTLSGTASNTVIENSIPFRYAGDAVPANLGVGNYTLKAEIFTADNAGGTKCDTKIISFSIQNGCSLTINAGADKTLCTSPLTVTSSITGAKTCTVPGVEDCIHSIHSHGGYVQNSATAGVCGDNAGAKLWTKNDNTTAWIVIDLGSQLPAGTQICTRMKLEHCGNTNSNYSSARVQASASSGSGYSNLVSAVTFSHTSYQDYCYTLSSAARFIKISDNGHCSIRVDYVKSTTPASSNSNITYAWSGPGIVGASNQSSITVNQAGTYTVTATNCDGSCTATDQMVVAPCPPVCTLTVNAGSDKEMCSATTTLNASSTGAKTCTTPGVEDCTHNIHSTGGYVQNASNAGVCGDNAGAKLWTKSNNTSAWIILDLGSQLPAGTQICARMKLEHCGNTSSNYSSVKIQASASAGSGYNDLVSAVTFSHTNFQNYCYTLTSPARYIKVLDNGHCSILLDYVKSTTTASSTNHVTYSWSGPGIVGASNQANITINQAGTYTVTATNCDGTCTATDTVVVNDCPPSCTLQVDAGDDQLICGPLQLVINSTVTGAYSCTTNGTSDCNHSISASGGWLENVNASAICGDNAGTKLWTKSGQGTSWITVDFGTAVPAGTSVCVRMKLEHCSNTSTSYSNAKIEASANSGSGFTPLTNSVTFTQTSFQEFCYTLTSSARYVKVSDNGNCAFRVDYVKYTTPSTPSAAVTYLWTGPGIVGVNNGASVTVNQSGTYIVTVTDCNGCVDTDEVQIINDTNPPILTGVPANLNVECADEVPAPVAVTAWDSINGNVQVIFSEVVTGGCPYAIIRTWTATDNCGNQASATQTINVHDTTDPQLHGVPSNINLSCDQNVPDCDVWASDNCDQELIVTLHAETILQECGYLFVRTWSVTDACGNSASASQTITFFDNTNPTVSQGVPASLTIECDDALIPSYLPTFEDNCDEELEVEASSSISNQTACGYDINRTWTATDDCGNSVSVSQVIHVVDTTNPVLVNVPANISVSCDAIPAPPTVNATDNCSDATVSFNEVVSVGCPYTITRTWTAVDECGNTASAIQVINVYDNIAPILHGVPANITLECDQPVPAINVIAIDNCSEDLQVELSANTVTNACGSVFTRTWTVADACGNETTATQIITFVDTTNPYVIEGVPAELTIECDEDVPSFSPVFGDNCDTDVEVTYISGIAGVTSCGHNIERSWTGTDNCGNAFTIYQVIHVVDTTNPVLVGVPANTTVECDAIPAPASVTATDNCSTAGVQLVELASPGCPYTITRTWTATDECGNQSEATQVITVNDTHVPVASNIPAPHVVFDCSEEIAFSEPTFTDNCDTNLTIDYTEFEVSGNCIPGYIRTWVATDDCGNSTTVTQVISINDHTAPVLVGVPANATVECDSVPAVPSVTAEDICDDDVEVSFTETITDGCPYTITRTWYAIDHCENPVTATQVITVVDSTYPVLHGVPANITLECDQPVSAVNVFATDNCSENLEVTLSANTQTADCGSVFTRTWTVADACGNETTATQVITFVDTTAPYVVEGVPAELTIECDEDVPSFSPVFGDNCDTDVEVTYISGIAGVTSCGHNIERSWTGTDNCGNAFTIYQVIHVVDTTNPVLVGVPANTTVECDAIPAPANVTATDNCSTAGVQLVEFASPGCPYTITRTWTATDECGNQSTATQIITVIDTTNPVLVGVPANATVECSNIPAAVVVTATDNCSDNLDVVYTQTTVPGTACTYTIVRTWTVEDACGNETSASQILTVTDTTNPTLNNVPGNITVECDAIPAAAQVTGSDNCDTNVEVTLEETTTEGCPYTITRTWTGVDNCGNEVSASQVITVIDTTFPVLHGVPANITLECDQPVPAVNVTATDNCTESLSVVLEANTITNDCGSVFTRTWTVADACGNETTATQIISFVDTTAPYFNNAPSNATVNCDAIPSVPYVTAGDNCDANVTVSFAQQTTEGCPYTITRTWTAIDDCNNQTIHVQTLTVIDTVDPIIVAPANLTVECSNIPVAIELTANDNCDNDVEVEFLETVVEGDGCEYTIVRTWTAIDNCENQTVVQQILTVLDTTYPVLVGVPGNTEVECDAVPSPSIVGATDNCSTNLIVTSTDEIEYLSCGYVITRTYSVSDACGNTTTQDQIITVVDTTNPVITSWPSDVTIECGDVVEEPGDVIALDNCDNDLEITMSEVTQDLDCGYVIIRTWRATDACGNQAMESQHIYVVDETTPEVTGVPSDITIECNQPIPTPAVITATDNCDNDVQVEVIDTYVAQECGYQIKRYYIATDDCGNATTHAQTITVTDTTAPVLVAPEDITVSCEDITEPAILIATDNCDLDVSVVYNEEVEGGCPYTIIRTWTATDDCGNQTTATQYVHVYDDVNPVFNTFSEYVEVECDQVATYMLTATDNCDADVEVTILSQYQVSGQCYGSLLRTYLATDNCGNTATAFQIIDIIDTTAPVLHNIPADVTITCGQTLPVIPNTVFATDNCSNDLIVEYSEVQTNSFCPYDLIRTWTVMDICGNVTTASQTIHVTVEVAGNIVLQAYPNPAQEHFTLKFSVPNDEIVTGEILDVAGRVVYTFMKGKADGGRLYNWDVDARNLNAGIYTISMKVGKEMVNEKLLITGR